MEEIAYSPGGSAANCAAIAGSLGLPVTFLGSIGNDLWSTLLAEDMHKNHIRTEFLKVAEGNSGTCVALVDANGERKFYSYRGVNESSPPGLPPSAIWKQHHCLHLSGYSFQEPNSRSTAAQLLLEAKRYGLWVSLDPSYLFAHQLSVSDTDLLPQLDFFFPNRDEAAQIGKSNDPLTSARAIREMGVKVVVVTLDKDGCLVLADGVEQFIKIEAPGTVVDTTGAGDAFCGGFLWGMLNGLSFVQAGKVGSAAAAHIVTKIGAHEQAPVLAELIGIVRQNRDHELADLLENKKINL